MILEKATLDMLTNRWVIETDAHWKPPGGVRYNEKEMLQERFQGNVLLLLIDIANTNREILDWAVKETEL